LKRLGVTSPRGEIEAFFDDPKGYGERHKRQTIERLCELAGKSRRDGNSLAAAADYNRALAYAPEDRELLRVVTSLQRAEARRRMVKRLAPPIFGAIVIGAAAFGITRFAKDEIRTDVTVSPKPSAHPSATVSAAVAITSATAPTTTAVSIAPIPTKTAAPKPTDRAIVFGRIKPINGVIVAVDNTPVLDGPSTGSRITLDLQKHTLNFSCKDDACFPDEKTIEAGDHDESIDILLKIRPAKLKIVGNPGSTYSSPDEPTLSIGMTSDAMVPMSSGQRAFAVTELPSNRTMKKYLSPNVETTFDFTKAAPTP
jgi:hypothetical protein